MTKALIVIDLQNDYATGGTMALKGIEAAVANAATIIADARKKHIPVIHVQHVFPKGEMHFFKPNTFGVEFQKEVTPAPDEDIVVKNYINSFRKTTLQEVLDKHGVTELTIIGAMSHMCIDACTRAAVDFGYPVTVVHDACATLDLEFNGVKAPAEHVHAAFMAALAFAYANVKSTKEYLSA
jgi:nicotinamidase-related amidase